MFETPRGHSDRSKATSAGSAPLQIPWPKSGARPASILFLGDTAFGENYQAALKAMGGRNILEDHGYDYSLANFRDTLLAADLVVANLETPLTDLARSPFAGKKRYIHWGHIEHTPACLTRHNIKTVSLANNHTFDYGAAGFDQTLAVLTAAGFNMLGAGGDLEASARPLLIEVGGVKIAVFAAFERHPDYERHFGVYAENDRGGLCPLDREMLAARIAALKHAAPQTFVIVFPHWGKNYRLRTELQARDAATLAEAGADLILGHGAHAVQEIERIGKTWVIYSLGNFVFNSSGRYKRFNAPPVSLVAQFLVGPAGPGARMTLKLFPILTSNEVTRFQPRFLSESEFRSTLKLLERISPIPADLVSSARIASENGRFCIEFVVK